MADITPQRYISETEFEVEIPVLPAGNYTASVTNSSGTGTTGFSVTDPTPAPPIPPDPDLKIFNLTDLNTPLDLGCSTAIQLPIEYNQYSSEYTVQLDDGTFMSGSFVEAGGDTQSSKLKIQMDRPALKTLQTFLFSESEFYIQVKYLDLWLYSEDWDGADEPLNAIFKVRKKGFSIDSRIGPNVYEVSLTIERLERI